MSDVADLKMITLLDVHQNRRAEIEFLSAEGETPVNSPKWVQNVHNIE